MKKIKYEINGTFIDIEASDEFAKHYEQIEAEEARQIWRDKKRKESSLERMVEAGVQVADPNTNVEERLLEKYDIEQLSEAITTSELVKIIGIWKFQQVEMFCFQKMLALIIMRRTSLLLSL